MVDLYIFVIVGVIIGTAATLAALFEYGVIPSQNQLELKVDGGVSDTSYHLPVLDIATGLGMRRAIATRIIIINNLCTKRTNFLKN